jgi:hypothetical protein
MRALALAIVLLAPMASGTALAGATNLRSDDAALIRHIKTTDYIFSKVLGECSEERLTRGQGGQFTYSSTCEIAPLPETDCQSYKVTASGTVDNEQWATVRDIRLKLQCSA